MRQLGLLLAVAAVSLAACSGGSSSAPNISVQPTATPTQSATATPTPTATPVPTPTPSPTPIPGSSAIPAPTGAASISGNGYTGSIVLGALTGSGTVNVTGVTATPPAGTPTYAPPAGGTTLGYLAVQNPNANPISYAGATLTLTTTAASGLPPYNNYFLALNAGNGSFFGGITPTSPVGTSAVFASTAALPLPAGATYVYAFYSTPGARPSGISAAITCATCTPSSSTGTPAAPGAINFTQTTYPQSAAVAITEPVLVGSFTQTNTCTSNVAVALSGGALTVQANGPATCAITVADGFSSANSVTINVTAPAPITGVVQ